MSAPNLSAWDIAASAFPHAASRAAQARFAVGYAILAPSSPAFGAGPMADMIDAVLGTRFTKLMHDREAAIAAYERGNAHVRATVPAHRLVEWTAKDGWGPLCKMLGVPVPAEPFPHANTTEEFKARVASGQGPPVHDA